MRPKLNLKSKNQMPLSHENLGSKILEKIKMYTLTRPELLFNLCYEIPCSWQKICLKMVLKWPFMRRKFSALFLQNCKKKDMKIFLFFVVSFAKFKI